MSNRFFNFVNTFIAGSVAKSADVNALATDIQAGFATAELELNTAIKLPASESATNVRIAEVAANRHGYVVGFDASGTAGAYNKWYIDWDANSHKITNLANPTASGDAVNLGYLNAYSASLAGIAAPGGSIGALQSTDGIAISWGNQGANSGYLLPTFPNGAVAASDDYSGSFLVMSNALPVWTQQGINLIFDPNGYRGTQFWTTSLDSTYNQKGYYWKNASPLVAATFDHTPNSDGFILCSPGINLSYSFRILTSGTTAGTIEALIEYYDAGYVLLSSSTPISIAMNTAIKYYHCSGATPAATAYVKPVLRFTGVSAPASAVEYRNPKLERGAVVTPFTDDFTLGWVVSYRETYYDGYNYANPRYVLGNTSAVSATQDFRSTTGSQAYDTRLQSTGGTNGTPGKGLLTITSKQVRSQGPIGYVSEYDAGNVGAGITIDFDANGARQKCVLDAAGPTITITAATQVGHYQLRVEQDPAVARVVTWAGIAAGYALGGALPVITTTLGGSTFIYLYWDGTRYWSSSANWS